MTVGEGIAWAGSAIAAGIAVSGIFVAAGVRHLGDKLDGLRAFWAGHR